jgi:hypothetical protein
MDTSPFFQRVWIPTSEISWDLDWRALIQLDTVLARKFPRWGEGIRLLFVKAKKDVKIHAVRANPAFRPI